MGPVATILQKPQPQTPPAQTPATPANENLPAIQPIPAAPPAAQEVEITTVKIRKNQNFDTWEQNHSQILKAIEMHAMEYNEFPSVTAIAGLTGISRRTVASHLEEYRSDSRYRAKIHAEKLMTERVLASVLQRAIGGDLKAAKIFLDKIN